MFCNIGFASQFGGRLAFDEGYRLLRRLLPSQKAFPFSEGYCLPRRHSDKANPLIRRPIAFSEGFCLLRRHSPKATALSEGFCLLRRLHSAFSKGKCLPRRLLPSQKANSLLFSLRQIFLPSQKGLSPLSEGFPLLRRDSPLLRCHPLTKKSYVQLKFTSSN